MLLQDSFDDATMRPSRAFVVRSARVRHAGAWIGVAMAVLAVGVAGFMLSPKIGALALAAPLVPLLVLAPAKAFLLVVATLPLDSPASHGGSALIQLIRLAVLPILGAWLLQILLRRGRLQIGIPGYLLCIYVMFAGASVLWAEAGTAGYAFKQLFQCLLLYVMVSNILAGRSELRRSIDVFIFATAAFALLVISQTPPPADLRRATIRLAGFRLDPNYLAASLTLPMLAAIVLGGTRSGVARWRSLAALALGAAAVLTGSRGATIAVLVGLAPLALGRPRQAVKSVALVAVIAGILAVTAPRTFEGLTARFEKVGEDRGAGRLDIWNVGLAMVADRPVTGLGLASFSHAFYRYMREAEMDPKSVEHSVVLVRHFGGVAAHSTYVNNLAELGIIGGGLLFAALAAHGVAVWRALRRARREGDGDGESLAIAALCMLAGLLAVGVNLDMSAFRTTWFVLGVVQATVASLRSSEAGATALAAAASRSAPPGVAT